MAGSEVEKIGQLFAPYIRKSDTLSSLKPLSEMTLWAKAARDPKTFTTSEYSEIEVLRRQIAANKDLREGIKLARCLVAFIAVST